MRTGVQQKLEKNLSQKKQKRFSYTCIHKGINIKMFTETSFLLETGNSSYAISEEKLVK